jgi:hypothetical protein
MRIPPLLAALLALAACGDGLPEPRFIEHTGPATDIVPTMPPPGKVEVIPPRPKDLKHPVWIDGEWEWSGRRWTWKEHGWQEQPSGESYAPPTTRRLPDGRLAHYRGAWKSDAEKPDAPKPDPAPPP